MIKISKINFIKPSKYYKIQLKAPWGVTSSLYPNKKQGSGQIAVGIADKKIAKNILEDLKKLISMYQK